MLVFFLAIPYVLIVFWLIRRSLAWTASCHGFCHRKVFKIPLIALSVFFAVSPLLGFLLPNSYVQHFLQRVSDFWLGVLLYTILAVAAALLIKFVLKMTRRIPPAKFAEKKIFARVGGFMAVVIAAVSIFGAVHYHDVKGTHYDASIDKPGSDFTIVLISDLHMGYNTGVKELSKDVDMINSMDPDIVCIAGDIFNNDYDALADPDKMSAIFRNINSKYGVYASYGNHDVSEPLLCGFTFSSDKHPVSDPRMDSFLKKSNIKLLLDESVLIDNQFYLAGRRDDEKPGRGSKTRMSADRLLSGLDKSKPIIVMDHSPSEIHQLSSAGCDLALSGHTHNGQLFPMNITSKLMWENPAGELKIGNMTSIVSSGIGVFGPGMRVGTDSEIVKIDVDLEQQ